MTAEDLSAVVKIEKSIFPDPWPKSAFEEQLSGSPWGGIVAESDGVVIGYACYYAVDIEGHLTNIAVDREYQRKSIAKQLLDNILTIIKGYKCEFVLLEVRESNTGAITFYEKYNFQHLYRRPKYYRKPVEDALVMVYYFDIDDEEK